ncbi:IclR family transcriptional regulator [Bosea sp. WAO]|uniref:IclR family transcriptional regulator n=1 Tax=Bosea sp. WAO TaxID=406341 RepID=UPI000836A2C0|nr:IclR family transcriptional regulator [Bosea sp. WAO]
MEQTSKRSTKEASGGRQQINSVVRAVNILQAIAKSVNGLTVREISDLIGIERQTTYHLVHTLDDLQMIARDVDRRYRLGVRIGNLIEPFQRQFSAPDYLNELVRTLARETGETSYGVGWSQGEIVVLSVAPGTNPVRTAEMPHGHYEHAHARAAGKLLLAYSPIDRRRDYLARHPSIRLTDHTLTTAAELDKEFTRIRQQGFATDLEEFAMGVCCMAAPLEKGSSPFSIALSAPAERFRENAEVYTAAIKRISAL